MHRWLPIALLALLLAGPAVGSSGTTEGLLAAGVLLEDGRHAEAAAAFEVLLRDPTAAEEPMLRLQAALGLGRARLGAGDVDRGLAAMAEGIAAADILGATMEEARALPVAARTELARALRELGRPVDGAAAGWDALDVAIASRDLQLAAEPVRQIVLAEIERGTQGEGLLDLVAELDLALSILTAYRLANPPPPEPIAGLLERTGQELAALGDSEAAAATFAALLELDLARGADWRLASDYEQLAWAALGAGQRSRAAWALEGFGDVDDVPASKRRWGALSCALSVAYQSWSAAAGDCELGIHDGREREPDPFRAAALSSRLGEVRAASGEPDRAVAAHEQAAAWFEEAGRPGDALLERARAAGVLVRSGRLEEGASKLDELLSAWGDEPVPAAVGDVRADVDLARLAAGAVPAEGRQALLLDVEGRLFQLERPEELLDVSLEHVRLAVATGKADDIREAVAAIARLEEDLGFAVDGHWEVEARSIAASSDTDRVALLEEAALRQERRLARSEQTRAAGEVPTLRLDPARVHARVASLHAAAGRPQAAARWTARGEHLALLVHVGPLTPASDDERRLADTRARLRRLFLQMRLVSLRGGERPPAEDRAELTPRIERLITEEQRLLQAIAEDRRALWSVTDPSPPGGPAPRKADFVASDKYGESCAIRGLLWLDEGDRTSIRARDVRPPDGFLDFGEALERGYAGAAVLLPGCADERWEMVFALAGAASVSRSGDPAAPR